MKAIRTLGVIEALAGLVGLLPLPASAQTVTGKAIGNGSIRTATIQLSVSSGMALHNGVYFGSVYVSGRVNGKSVTLSAVASNPLFAGEGGAKTCVATSDITFNRVSAHLTYTWTQFADKTGTVAWTVTDDAGALLFGSNGDGSPVSLATVSVTLPQ